MESRTKAIELVKRFLPYIKWNWRHEDGEAGEETAVDNAKQCAYIVCDEMIEELVGIMGGTNNNQFCKYWQEVKSTIELITVHDKPTDV